jgi:TolB protein
MITAVRTRRFITLFFFGVIGLALVQCGGEPITGPGDATLNVTPQSLNFGEITERGSKTIRFSNPTSDSIIISSVTINEPSFSFGGGTPFQLNATESEEFDVNFNYSAYSGQDSVFMKIVHSDSANSPLIVNIVTPYKRVVTNISNSRYNEYPVGYSPGGSRILYYSDERTKGNNIYTMNTDGEDVQQLTNDGADNIPVSYSPDSTRILYYSNAAGGIYNIYTMASDGSDVQQLTNNGDDEYAVAYSHDGSMIAYYRNHEASDGTPNNEVYIMASDGSNPVRITSNDADDQPSVFSWNDQYLLFKSDRNNNLDIFRINVSGSGLKQLTEDPSDDYATDVDSDNRVLIYSGRDGRREAYTMSIEGTDLIRLTDNYWYDGPKVYDSTGGFVLLRSFKAGNQDVYKASIRGSVVERITSDPDEDRPVAFSPDDANILFYSFRNGNAQVYVTNN